MKRKKSLFVIITTGIAAVIVGVNSLMVEKADSEESVFLFAGLEELADDEKEERALSNPVDRDSRPVRSLKKSLPFKSVSEEMAAIYEQRDQSSSGLAREALRRWLAEDEQGVRRWLHDFPSGRERALLAMGVYQRYQELEASEVQLSNFLTEFSQDEQGWYLIAQVASIHLKQGREDGLSWLATVSEGPARTRAVKHQMSLWVAENMNAPADWLLAQHPSPSRDEALAAYAASVAIEDSSAARHWVEMIDDSELRVETFAQISIYD